MPDAVAESAPEPFAACFSIPKLIAWVAVSGGMAVLALLFLLGGASGGQLFVLVLGGLGVLFFGGIAAVHAMRLFDRRPQVVLHDRSIYVRAHGEALIPLRSIKSVRTDGLGQISLILNKPAKYPIETRHRRFLYRLNGSAARGFFGDVWIRTNVLDCSRGALLDAMAEHRPMTEFEKRLAERIAANS
ncbi:STM3941 family protein [Porphyrobacter sp. ULC335]|uniref:STM3941 family protein n=1 Tax=Porphyrobacter sp. ULC335 TaxID=2854260 RepID=UPI00221FEBB4|nr:STM3941 family protein [Porphyrobacter sp. ULC335]UYV16349.1 hypothetical protein KVF90_03165 [Porphyrobacter sp. ULC335]